MVSLQPGISHIFGFNIPNSFFLFFPFLFPSTFILNTTWVMIMKLVHSRSVFPDHSQLNSWVCASSLFVRLLCEHLSKTHSGIDFGRYRSPWPGQCVLGCILKHTEAPVFSFLVAVKLDSNVLSFLIDPKCKGL